MLDAVAKAFALRWDFLFRAAASIVGLVAAVGYFTRRSPLATLERLLEWVHWNASVPYVEIAARWVSSRSDVIAIIAVIGVLLGVVLTTYSGRGAALAVAGAAVDAQAGGHAAVWILAALGVAATAAFIVARFGSGRWYRELDAVDDWCRSAVGQIIAATCYLIVGWVTWIADAPPRRPSWA